MARCRSRRSKLTVFALARCLIHIASRHSLVFVDLNCASSTVSANMIVSRLTLNSQQPRFLVFGLHPLMSLCRSPLIWLGCASRMSCRLISTDIHVAARRTTTMRRQKRLSRAMAWLDQCNNDMHACLSFPRRAKLYMARRRVAKARRDSKLD